MRIFRTKKQMSQLNPRAQNYEFMKHLANKIKNLNHFSLPWKFVRCPPITRPILRPLPLLPHLLLAIKSNPFNFFRNPQTPAFFLIPICATLLFHSICQSFHIIDVDISLPFLCGFDIDIVICKRVDGDTVIFPKPI